MKTWIVQSAIIVGMNPGKPLEIQLSENPHKANKIIGRLLDGTAVIVSLRPGRGGVPINKLSTGKVFAVAADSFSPVYEKEGGKPTKRQKVEADGTLHFSTGACYLMSTGEYKALVMGYYLTYVPQSGDEFFVIDSAAITTRVQVTLRNKEDYVAFLRYMCRCLNPNNNWMHVHNSVINRVRARKIRTAQEQADEEGYVYEGIQPNDLDIDPRDGAPTVFLDVRDAVLTSQSAFEIVRCAMGRIEPDTGRISYTHMSHTDRMKTFANEPLAHRIVARLKAGREVVVSIAQGATFRQSVSTKKKFANALDGSNSGDSFYCNHAIGKWTNSMVGVMHSTHPRFPNEDYTTNHFVASLRQAEVLMENGSGSWRPLDIPGYDIPASIYAGEVIRSVVQPLQDRAYG